MLQIQPIRHGMIKKYFDKYKYQRKKRTDILKYAEEGEEMTKNVLGSDYVHFMDAIPEIRTFLAELEAKEKLTPSKFQDKEKEDELLAEELEDQKAKLKKKEAKIEEIEFDPDTFNPFDKGEQRKQEADIKPLQPRKLLKINK